MTSQGAAPPLHAQHGGSAWGGALDLAPGGTMATGAADASISIYRVLHAVATRILVQPLT